MQPFLPQFGVGLGFWVLFACLGFFGWFNLRDFNISRKKQANKTYRLERSGKKQLFQHSSLSPQQFFRIHTCVYAYAYTYAYVYV